MSLHSFGGQPAPARCAADLRMVGGLPASAKDGLWPLLEHHLQIEGSEPLESPYLLAHRALARGQLDSTLSTCGSGTECDSLVWLVAASDGAGPSDVQVAMNLADARRGLTGHAAFAAFALARREGQHVDVLAEALRAAYPDRAPDVIAITDPAKLSTEPGALEPMLSGLDPFFRGQAYVMAVVATGAEAPPAWKARAKALLFADERPYFD